MWSFIKKAMWSTALMAGCASGKEVNSHTAAGESATQRLATSHLRVDVNAPSPYVQGTWGLNLGYGDCVVRNWHEHPHMRVEDDLIWVGHPDPMGRITRHQLIAKKEGGQYMPVCPNSKIDTTTDQVTLTTPMGVVVYHVDDQDPTIYRPSKRLLRRAANGKSWLSMIRE